VPSTAANVYILSAIDNDKIKTDFFHLLANHVFAIAAPSSWNSLPYFVRDSQSYSNFYPNLKLTILALHFIIISSVSCTI